MIDEEVSITLLVIIVAALILGEIMLASIRNVLEDISYKLSICNLAGRSAKVRYVEDSTTEIDS